MKDLFKHASSSWVRYDRYEWKKDKNNRFYITPAPNAMPKIYDPLKGYQQMVLDALNVGLMIRTSTKRKIRERFVHNSETAPLFRNAPLSPMLFLLDYFLAAAPSRKIILLTKKPWKRRR